MARIILITFILHTFIRYSTSELDNTNSHHSSAVTTDAPVSNLSKPPDFVELLAASLTTTPLPLSSSLNSNWYQNPINPEPIDWSALLLNHQQANENITTFTKSNTFLPGSDLPLTERTTYHQSPAPKQEGGFSPVRRKKRPRPKPAPRPSTTPSTTTTTTTSTTTRPPKYYISDPEEDEEGSNEDDDDPPRDIYAQFSDSDPQHHISHGNTGSASSRTKTIGYQHRRPPPYYYSELAAPSTSNIDYNHEEDLQELPQDSHYNVIRSNQYYSHSPPRYPPLPPPSRDTHEPSNNGYYQPSYFLEDIHRQGPNGDRQPPSLSAWSSGLTGFLLGIIPLSLLVASIAPAFMSVPVGAAMAAGAAGRRKRRRKRQVDFDLSQDRESLRFLNHLLEKNPYLSEHLILKKMTSRKESNVEKILNL